MMVEPLHECIAGPEDMLERYLGVLRMESRI